MDGGDLLPTITMPSDVVALQAAIKADRDRLVAALQRCVAAGKFGDTFQPEWDQWQSVKERVLAYLAESPNLIGVVSQFERGEALKAEQATWFDKTKALGCDAGTAPGPFTTSDTSSPFGAFFAGGATGVLLLLAAMYLMGKGK